MDREALIKRLNGLSTEYYEKTSEYPFMYYGRDSSRIYEFAGTYAITENGNALITVEDMERLLNTLGKEVIATENVHGNNCKDKIGVVIRVSVEWQTVRVMFHDDSVNHNPWYLRGKEFKMLEKQRTKHIMDV